MVSPQNSLEKRQRGKGRGTGEKTELICGVNKAKSRGDRVVLHFFLRTKGWGGERRNNHTR